MKKNLILPLLLLFCLNAAAQIDTLPLPSGYLPGQLSAKKLLRVSPDNHVWVSFTHIGAGEFDGTNWRIYCDTNGLHTNTVTALAFEGNIRWIGTDSGLFKTDGVNFLSFNNVNSPLPSNHITSLYLSDTALWIGTDRGATAVSQNMVLWQTFTRSNSPILSDTVVTINGNSFGVYISHNSGVSVKTSNGWTATSPDIGTVYRFTSDKGGNLYWKNYQISDSIFSIIRRPYQPCLPNVLYAQPQYFIGAESNNQTYAMSNVLNPAMYVLEYDSAQNIQTAFSVPPSLAAGMNPDTFQLFDLSHNGQLISTNYNQPIVRVTFAGLSTITSTDSCPFLDINQVQARICNNGSMFWDMQGHSLYETPKNSGLSPIFCEGLWLGGKDQQGNLHLAAQTYRQSGNDFWPGPLDTTDASITLATSQLYDKLWKIDRYTINVFIEKFLDGSVANGTYTIPDIILNWPAHGTGNISRNLAPFVDYNSDGIYNPADGDYPDIKGDQMFWWVFNDNLGVHDETGSPYNLGVEIHGSAYAYTCPLLTNKDSVINYTTFYHYDFINRSDTNYHDVYTEVYTDIDLGNYLDDYVGCDTSMDIAYAYNGDDDDEFSNGYGLHPPMINLAVLNGPLAAANDGIDNNHNGVTDEANEHCMLNHFVLSNNDFTATGNPVHPQDYYWRMQSIWKDGIPITYGNTGYDSSSTNYTNYMFSGNPYDSNQWSELHPCSTCSENNPSDRRFNVSSGPFDLPAHQKRSIDYAYVYTRESNLPNGQNTSFALNRDQVLRIKHFFETDSFPCKHLIGIDEVKNEISEINLYPNPAQSEIFVSLLKDLPGTKTYFITDILGSEITRPVKTTASAFRIDVSKLRPGLYFLHVESSVKSGIRKFVVD